MNTATTLEPTATGTPLGQDPTATQMPSIWTIQDIAAFYCAAIPGLGNKPHHEMFEVYSSVLTHRVLDAFGVGHGTVAWDLLHFAMENAASLAKNGRLDDDPHLASFMSEAAQIELLTLVEGTFTPEDFD